MAGITKKVFEQMIKELKNPKSNVSKDKLKEKILKYMKVYGSKSKNGYYYESKVRTDALEARDKYYKNKK